MPSDKHLRMIEHIFAGRRDEAVQLFFDYAEINGVDMALREVLEPVLIDIGRRWDREGDLNLAQGYIAGKIAENIMNRLAEAGGGFASVPPNPLKSIVIGNIEDDYHSLGRRIVVNHLKIKGWRVVDLGDDVPADDFISAALANAAPVIGVSAMMMTTARNIIGIRHGIDARGLGRRLKLAVGGAVFVQYPELLREVGADGTATNAFEAPEAIAALAAQTMGVQP